jgi:small subunit ribosomal protein S6e
LRKTDDVRKYVVRREIKKGDKTFYKSPKIQRLVTEKRIRRKKQLKKTKLANFKKAKEDKAKYDKILSKYIKEKKAHAHGAEEPAKETKPAQQPAQKAQAPAAK